MSEMPPKRTPEKSELLDDNARKFITKAFDHGLMPVNATVSFQLIVDWIETTSFSETKVAYKQFDSGETQILLISKITNNTDRSTKKQPISLDEYQTLLYSSTRHLEKRRHEFDYAQNDISFSVKFDEFAGGKLLMLEVDGVNDSDRNAFDPSTFPAELTEVTGDIRYYGYHVADLPESK